MLIAPVTASSVTSADRRGPAVVSSLSLCLLHSVFIHLRLPSQ